MKHVEMIIDYITDGTDFQYGDNHDDHEQEGFELDYFGEVEE